MKNALLSILAYIGSTILVLVGMVVAALIVLITLGPIAVFIALLTILIVLFLLLVAVFAPVVSLPMLFRRKKIQQFVKEATTND